MKKTIRKILIETGYIAASIGLVAILWYVLYIRAGSEYIFPSFGAVMTKTIEYVKSGFFWQSTLSTVLRSAISFFSAFALAAVTGILAHVFPPVKKILAPIIKIIRSAPTVAVIIIINLLAVKPKIAPIIVAFTVIYPILYSSMVSALSGIDNKLVEMSKTYEVPTKKRILWLYLPSVAPYVLSEAGGAAAFNLKIVVSAEILAYTYRSLGGVLQSANVYSDISGVIAVTIFTVILATIIELTVGIIEKAYKKRRRML